jgi:hypothetical protein
MPDPIDGDRKRFKTVLNPYKHQRSQQDHLNVASPNTEKKISSASSIVTPSSYPRTASATVSDVSKTRHAASSIDHSSLSSSTMSMRNEKNDDVSKQDIEKKRNRSPSPPVGDKPLKSILCDTRYSGPYQSTLTQIDRQKQHDVKQVDVSKSKSKDNEDAQLPNDKLCDLRGFRVGTDGPTLPFHYCPYCRCPPVKCHEFLVGELVELEVISEMMDFDIDPTDLMVETAVQACYQRAIRHKIYDETRTLDISDHTVPYCLELGTQSRLYEYVRVSNYHHEMQKLITVGRDKPIYLTFGTRKSSD